MNELVRHHTHISYWWKRPCTHNKHKYFEIHCFIFIIEQCFCCCAYRAGSHFSRRSSSEYVEIDEYFPYLPMTHLLLEISIFSMSNYGYFSLFRVCSPNCFLSIEYNSIKKARLKRSELLSIQLECIRNWFCFGLFDFFGFGLYLLCFCCGFVLDFVAAFARLYSAHQIHIVRIYGHFILGL